MSRRLIQRLILGLVALCAAFAVARVTLFARTARAKGPEIKTARVERGDVVSSVTASGTLQALTTVDVKSNVGGRVEKGQLIAKIDPTDTNTQFEQARADYDAAIARLQQAQINLKLQEQQNKAEIAQARTQLQSAR